MCNIYSALRNSFHINYCDVHERHGLSNHSNVCSTTSPCQIKWNIKSPHGRPFGRGIHRWIPLTKVDSPLKGSVMRKAFPGHDVIIFGNGLPQECDAIQLSVFMVPNIEDCWCFVYYVIYIFLGLMRHPVSFCARQCGKIRFSPNCPVTCMAT